MKCHNIVVAVGGIENQYFFRHGMEAFGGVVDLFQARANYTFLCMNPSDIDVPYTSVSYVSSPENGFRMGFLLKKAALPLIESSAGATPVRMHDVLHEVMQRNKNGHPVDAVVVIGSLLDNSCNHSLSAYSDCIAGVKAGGTRCVILHNTAQVLKSCNGYAKVFDECARGLSGISQAFNCSSGDAAESFYVAGLVAINASDEATKPRRNDDAIVHKSVSSSEGRKFYSMAEQKYALGSAGA